MHTQNSFITLTYDEDHLPPDGSLRVRDWQVFAKQLRNKLGPFRFFHCGEYGDRSGRAHLHAAIFGRDFTEDRVFENNSKTGHPLHTSETLGECWPHGKHWIGNLTFDSAAYVARYIMKKQLGECAWRRYGTTVDCEPGEAGTWHTSNRFTLQPEYATMSRNPGLGSTWIQKYMTDVYPHDYVMSNGKKCRPPRFYDEQYEKVDPEGYKRMKIKRAIESQKILRRHPEENQYTRLAVRETVQKAKISAFTRDN